ncbi:MAG TPA: M56 family metallopeptidase [Acidobacteriota bacterium]
MSLPVGLAIQIVLKATLVLIAAVAVAAAARRASAAGRHFVWACALLVLLALPAFTLLLPAWSPTWLPVGLSGGGSFEDAGSTEKGAPTSSAVPSSMAGGTIGAPPPAVRMAVNAIGETAPHLAAAADSTARYRTPGWLGVGFDPPASGAPSALLAAYRSISTASSMWLGAIWLAGAAMMTVSLGAGFFQRSRLARRALALRAGPCVEAARKAARDLELRRPVTVLHGRSRTVPMTWGFLRPILYLPAEAASWSRPRLRAVALHELAHVKRADSVSRTIAQAACALFWFHPLAWLAARRMLAEQERACDDVVLLAGVPPHAYAETLVSIAREFGAPRPAVAGALALARRSNLESRLLSILDPLARRQKMTTLHRSLLLTTFVFAALPVAALQPASAGLHQNTTTAQAPARPTQATALPQRAATTQVVALPAAATAPLNQATATPAVAQAGASVTPQRATTAQVAVQQTAANAPAQGATATPAAAPRASTTVTATAAQQTAVTAFPGHATVASTGARAQAAAARAPAAAAEAVATNRPAAATAQQRPEPAAGDIRIQAQGVRRLRGEIERLALDDDGWLRLSEGDRHLEVEARDGGLDITYLVANQSAELDAEAREWAEEILRYVSRRMTLRGNIFVSFEREEMESSPAPPAFAFESPELVIPDIAPLAPLTVEIPEFVMPEMAPLPPITIEIPAIVFPHMAPLPPFTFEVPEIVMPNMAPLPPFSVEIPEILFPEMAPLAPITVEIPEIVMPDIKLPAIAVDIPSLAIAGDFVRSSGWTDDEGNRFLAVRLGRVRLAETIDALELGPDGLLLIDERAADGGHRRLYITGEEGAGPRFEWLVDGQEQPFDAAGRAWLEPILRQLAERRPGAR